MQESMELYRGGFKKDLYHGYGTLRYPNGSIKYEGEYRNGVRHGTGTLYLQNGTLIVACSEITNIMDWVYLRLKMAKC